MCFLNNLPEQENLLGVNADNAGGGAVFCVVAIENAVHVQKDELPS